MTYVGLFVILIFMLMGFWLLTFLASFIPLMATLLFLERFNPAAGEKLAEMLGNDDL